MLVSLKGKVTSDLVQSIKQKISKSKKKKIVICIDSSGGDPAAALDLHNFLKGETKKGRKIIGWVPKQAHSSALLIFEGCSKRVCSPDAKFVVHNTSTTFVVGITRTTNWKKFMSRMGKMWSNARKLQNHFDQAAIESTLLPRETFIQLSNAGSNGAPPLSAEEAKFFGFVDSISRLRPS